MSGTAWVILDDRPVNPLPPGWAPLTGHRTAEEWTWRIIDPATRSVTGDLDGVEGGDLTFNVFADTRAVGDLTWSGTLAGMPSWRNIRVQPVYTATLGGGAVVTWPMGVYLCSSPSVDVEDGWAQVDVALYDLTLLLRRARLSAVSGVNAGTNVVDHVRSIINTQAPSVTHAVEDSDVTLRSSMTWDADTPWLRVINDLLDAAGMVALWADADGVLRSSPYIRPQERPVVWDFAEGVTAVHEAGLTHDRDDFDVPNRVTAISRSDEDTPALRSQVRLDDLAPGHPLSFAATGTWVDRVETEVEAASLEVLTQRAERWMWEGLSVTSTAKVVHAPLPLALQDRVTLTTGGLLVPSATVQAIDVPCAAGADWTTTIREVVA